MPGSTRTQLAVFASGRGSNFEVLARASEQGTLGGTITLLCCDNPGAPVLARAERFGIEALTLPTGRFRTRIEDESVWLQALKARGIEVILLAGFMRRLHHTLLDAFPDRILNIHPSLLPAYSGADAIKRAYDDAVPQSGCTVHLINEELDAGPVIDERTVDRGDHDTFEEFEARIHEAEHDVYPRAVRRYLEDSWERVDNRLVWTSQARND